MLENTLSGSDLELRTSRSRRAGRRAWAVVGDHVVDAARGVLGGHGGARTAVSTARTSGSVAAGSQIGKAESLAAERHAQQRRECLVLRGEDGAQVEDDAVALDPRDDGCGQAAEPLVERVGGETVRFER